MKSAAEGDSLSVRVMLLYCVFCVCALALAGCGGVTGGGDECDDTGACAPRVETVEQYP